MFMPYNPQNAHAGHSTTQGLAYQDRNTGLMVNSHMNMIPVARPIQSIHGIGPNNGLTGQKSQQAGGDRDMSDYRRVQPPSSDKDNHHHVPTTHASNNSRSEPGKPARQFPARAIMQVPFMTCI